MCRRRARLHVAAGAPAACHRGAGVPERGRLGGFGGKPAIEATRELVACGYIPERSECSTTFPLREYRGNAVRLACKQCERSFLSAPFVMSPPGPIAGRPARAAVILRDAGEFSARLVP